MVKVASEILCFLETSADVPVSGNAWDFSKDYKAEGPK